MLFLDIIISLFKNSSSNLLLFISNLLLFISNLLLFISKVFEYSFSFDSSILFFKESIFSFKKLIVFKKSFSKVSIFVLLYSIFELDNIISPLNNTLY